MTNKKQESPRKPEWSRVTMGDVLRACAMYDSGVERPEPRRKAKSTFLIHDGKEYPGKFIRGVAYRLATGVEPDPNEDYSGGPETVRFFESLGLETQHDPAPRRAAPAVTAKDVTPSPAKPVPPHGHVEICRKGESEKGQQMTSGLRVGTLSSELQGAEMRLTGEERINAIMDVLKKHSPDVLLTAGYSLSDENDLACLKSRLNASSWNGLLFVEVEHYNDDLANQLATGERLSDHCLFAWTRDDGMMRMGRQYFATSDEARANLATRVAAFVENLPQRMIEFRGRRFGALICGEINALQGRNNVTALTPKIGNWLRGLHVVVNPTHDRMGNAGTLIAKRAWISQGGRAYLSASNWNTRSGQKRSARTLHSVFRSGQEVSQVNNGEQNTRYEYRESCI
jgi:hypothetical protein